jgi:mRNA-degrading endonuclease toxin of MazEF toxin-antitoxin module
MPIERGEIYLVDLNPVQGREQAERRPVLVLSVNAINRLPLVATCKRQSKSVAGGGSIVWHPWG